jgi:hypothetical protein
MVYFQTKNPDLGIFLVCLRLENVVIFYVHLEYFTDIWYIVWLFGKFLCSFGTFFPVLVSLTKKNLATLNVFLRTAQTLCVMK